MSDYDKGYLDALDAVMAFIRLGANVRGTEVAINRLKTADVTGKEARDEWADGLIRKFRGQA